MSAPYDTRELVLELQERVETREWGTNMVRAYTDVLGIRNSVPESIWKRAEQNEDRLKKYPR